MTARTADIRADAKAYLDAARRWGMIALFDGDGRCTSLIASDLYAKLVAEGKSVGGVAAH